MKLNRTLVMAVSIVLAAALSIGGTLAYMTDRESAVNVFTVGNVDIELIEDYEDDSKLLPGVDVNKDVSIKNIGDEPAWVWYTYSIPAALDAVSDDGDHMLHVEHEHATTTGEDDKWIVDYTPDGVNTAYVGTEEIDGIAYNIYAVLYTSPLPRNEETNIGMSNVYLDEHVDYNPNDEYFYWVNDGEAQKIANADGSAYDIAGAKLYVNAYAIQQEGFTSVQDAYKAYGDQWGTNFNAAVNNLTASNAQNKLTAGGTVNVAEDIVLTEASTPLRKAATITLNGDLTASRTNSGDGLGAEGVSVLTVYDEVTINGSGTVENTDGAYAITVRDEEARLTIKNGTFKAATTAVQVTSGTLVIEGGHFEVSGYNDGEGGDPYRYLINCIDDAYRNGTAKVKVIGGTFVNFNPNDNASEGAHTDYVPEGYKVVSEAHGADTWYTVVPE